MGKNTATLKKLLASVVVAFLGPGFGVVTCAAESAQQDPSQQLKLADTLHRYGADAAQSGMYKRAELNFLQEYDLRKRILGATELSSLRALRSLATMVQVERRYDEAEALDRQLYQDSRRGLGLSHWMTRTALVRLLLDLEKQGHHREAQSVKAADDAAMLRAERREEIFEGEIHLSGNILGATLPQAVVDNATKQWNAIDPYVLQCLTKNYSLVPAKLARQGIGPDDQRVVPYIQSCQQNVGQAPQQFTQRSMTAGGPNRTLTISEMPLLAHSSDAATFLPWPPLAPSSRGDVTQLVGLSDIYSDVADHISRVLVDSGYRDAYYFSVPGGFAIMTALEHVGPGGETLPEDARWSLAKETANWSWFDYVKKLFVGPDGRYRLFLFIVTAQYYGMAQDIANGQDVERWLHTGKDVLAPALATRPLESGTTIHLFVYEFSMDHGRMTQSDRLLGLRENTSESLPFTTHLKALHFRGERLQ